MLFCHNKPGALGGVEKPMVTNPFVVILSHLKAIFRSTTALKEWSNLTADVHSAWLAFHISHYKLISLSIPFFGQVSYLSSWSNPHGNLDFFYLILHKTLKIYSIILFAQKLLSWNSYCEFLSPWNQSSYLVIALLRYFQ